VQPASTKTGQSQKVQRKSEENQKIKGKELQPLALVLALLVVLAVD